MRRRLGREERLRTVISGMEPRRIAVVMLLPRGMSTKKRLSSEAINYFMRGFLSIKNALVL